MKTQVRTSLTARTAGKIDEAHLLTHAQLEAVRILTNSEMDAASPLACLLIGQPTLRRMPRLGVGLAALDQRIGLSYAMPAMTAEQTAGYITHHLQLAGRSDTIFSDDAMTLVHDAARGLPRAVNNIATQALVAALAARKNIVDEQPPAPLSTRSRQTDHHHATPHTKAPPAAVGGAFFTPAHPHRE